MTITPELKAAVERAGDEPIRLEDPETKTTYPIIREEVYRELRQLAVIDQVDRSLYEFGEFHPHKGRSSFPGGHDSDRQRITDHPRRRPCRA
jgi:hypothetical protein